MYNIMTCEGLGTDFMGACALAWLGVGLLVFILLIARRQVDNFGFEFNVIGAGIGAFLPYLIFITITGAVRWSLLFGIVGLIVGGFIGGKLFGGGEEFE